MNKKIFLILVAFLSTMNALAQVAESPQEKQARLKWFTDARFGMFIHWGVYAVPAGEYKGNKVNGLGEWIMKEGRIPVNEYKAFANDFTASKYNPTAWAKLAKQAGMKYVVITSKHHDGFALYDSKVCDWNSVQASGAKRDLISPLEKAVRNEGLKFGLYYSQAQDWVNGGSGAGWDSIQKKDFPYYLLTVALPQVDEILTAFKPDILWWDTPFGMTKALAVPFAKRINLEKNMIMNDRLGGGFGGDTETPEQHIPPRGYPGKLFEVCMTMNDTWGYKKEDHKWKSTKELIQKLSDITSKGGNFLLNVGPNAEGEIPEPSIQRLKEIGKWMDVNGEAIYATEASPFVRRLPWGRVTRKPNGKGGETLYLHIWEWPSNAKILLPHLEQSPINGAVLADNAPVKTALIAEGLVVNLTGAARDSNVSVIALNFDKPIVITKDGLPSVGKDGSIALSAFDADAHGSLSGNIVFVGSGSNAYLSNWNKNYKVEFMLRTPAVKKWKVTAEIVAQKATKLNLFTKKTDTSIKKQIPVEIALTGKPKKWKSVELGTIELPAGETSFELIPIAKDWNPIELKKVILTPVK